MRSWLLAGILWAASFLGWPAWLLAQNGCNSPGQSPVTAFPVCGSSVFTQTSVNLCGGRRLPNPRCTNIDLTDINPYWYKFTCFRAGTLGFTITPNSAASDYDWQLHDITGKTPDAVYTDASTVVAANWSGFFGMTGASAAGTNLIECEGSVPQFSRMPTLIEGHQYLLLVSHFSNNQSGYRLAFGSGTAIIVDTARPEMVEVQVGCGGTEFYLKLNKRMKCNSVATNGSDWEFFNANVPIASARAVGCANGGFDTDSIIITTVAPVPAGTFALRSKPGTDGNTLLDLCDNALAAGQTLVVNVLASSATLIDSIGPIGCAPGALELVMRNSILCSSIATNGSDFVLTGPDTVRITGAVQPACSSGQLRHIKLQLSSPLKRGGTYQLSIATGTDGNTLLNQCRLPTPAGHSASFTVSDTVSANIQFSISSSCFADTILYSHDGAAGVTSWQWNEEGSNATGSGQQFRRIYTTPDEKRVSLTVSNGVCSSTGQIVLSPQLLRVKANFELPAFACPADTVRFTDRSTGPVTSWLWTFGNGNTSNLSTPPAQRFSSLAALSTVPVTLVVGHTNGCRDTITKTIKVPNNCFIAVPGAFTPNGDGLNDYLYPLNAWKATNLHFVVYNRMGQLVWETRDWNRQWDGRLGGVPQATGTYVWMLQYTDENGQRQQKKGTTVLLR